MRTWYKRFTRALIAVPREYWYAALIILFTVSIQNGFYVYALLRDVPGFVYTGLFGIPKWDMTVYYSMIEQVRQGAWLVQNVFTSEAQGLGLLHPLWVLLGMLARIFDISSASIFQWSRILTSITALVGIYALSRVYLHKQLTRLLFLGGIAWMGGVGRWVTFTVPAEQWADEIFILQLPVDVWLSEGFVNLTLLHSPLFIISQMLLIALWWLVASGAKRPWGIAIGLGLLGLMHPYDIPLFWGVVLVWASIMWHGEWMFVVRLFKKLLPSIISTICVVVYYGYVVFSNPTLGGWLEQNVTAAPALYAFITGYGWILLVGILGLWLLYTQFQKSNNPYIALLFAWCITIPFLMYAPGNQIARRFIATFGIALPLVAAYSIEWFLYKKYAKKLQQTKHVIAITSVATVCIIFSIISPLYYTLQLYQETYYHTQLPYLEQQTFDAITWVHTVAPETVVLLPYRLGNVAPGLTSQQVYVGHGHQTINFDTKYTQATIFYGTSTLAWKQRFIAGTNISYILWETNRLSEVDSLWPMVYKNDTYSWLKVSE